MHFVSPRSLNDERSDNIRPPRGEKRWDSFRSHFNDEKYERLKAGELDKSELGGKLTELLRIHKALRTIFKCNASDLI